MIEDADRPEDEVEILPADPYEEPLILEEPKRQTSFPNLATAVKPGEVRNPHGRPKGSVNLSTIVERMMARGEIDWSKVPLKGGKKVNDRMVKKYGKRGWVALTYVAFAKAMEGDANARKWLSDAAYGNKATLDITSGGAPMQPAEVTPEMQRKFLEMMKDQTKA